MKYIDPHIHMISRVTDDYQRMALCRLRRGQRAGVLGRVRPRRAPRASATTSASSPSSSRSGAAQFGIEHYCWLCINAKEAENVALSREVIAMIPEFLDRPNVLGIGEIGLNKNTRNEATIFQEHLDLAMKTDELILIHTPHLEDKYKGTRMILDMLKDDRRVKPRAGAASTTSRSTPSGSPSTTASGAA